MTMLLIVAVNLIVGVCIGLTGIAGFLLPMFYTGFLGMPAVESLALSFAAFFISGALGSVNYFRSGNLDLKTAAVLSAGSLAGAVLGVNLNLLIPEEAIRLLLYLVVLLSGASILVREYLARRGKAAVGSASKTPGAGTAAGTDTTAGADTIAATTPALRPAPAAATARSAALYLLLGLSTGAVCAASGAGGPVLVMPLLTTMGFPAHMAVGISLFDSIFIAIPSAAGYIAAARDMASLLSLLPLVLLFHGIGVLAGSRYAVRINQGVLKAIVAASSILIACAKLAPLIAEML